MRRRGCWRLKRIIVTIFPVCILFANAGQAELRTWTFTSDGKIETGSGVWTFRKGGRVDAEFVRRDGTNVILELPNGKNCCVPAASLSEADRVYLDRASDRPTPRQSSSQKPSSQENGRRICVACGGAGTVPCRAGGCSGGKLDCPGPCLKLSRGEWVHLNVTGHDPNELWQKFPIANGKYVAWNQGHVGEVIEIQNGQPVNIGRCKICRGTGKVDCSVCKGSGRITCSRCGGTGR